MSQCTRGFDSTPGGVVAFSDPLSERRNLNEIPVDRCRARRDHACRARAGADQGRDRHFGLDRLRAADARQGGRHLREERPRRDDQEDPAGEPPPRDRVGRRAVRRHHGRDLGGMECERRRDHAAVPARQVLRRRRHGGAQQYRVDQGREGQAGRGLRARHRALLHARLVPEEERPVREGRDRRQHGARARPRRPSSPGRTTSR